VAVTIDATVQDAYPPRVLLTIAGLSVGVSVVELRRVVAGQRQTMRGGGVDPTATTRTVVDAEMPYGTPVSWQVIDSVSGTVLDTAGPLTVTLTGGKVAISDAVTGAAAEVVILNWPARSRDVAATVYPIAGRNIVVSGGLGQYTATVELFTETTAGSDALRELLTSATSGIVLVRQPGPYDGVDAYWAVLGADDTRFSQDGSDERRVWQIDVAETSQWAPTLEAAGFTLQDLANYYSGLTLADVDTDFATLLDLAQADLSI
jgi:hypothetical protein